MRLVHFVVLSLRTRLRITCTIDNTPKIPVLFVVIPLKKTYYCLRANDVVPVVRVRCVFS
jgi:hypothetical protein